MYVHVCPCIHMLEDIKLARLSNTQLYLIDQQRFARGFKFFCIRITRFYIYFLYILTYFEISVYICVCI